MIIAAIILLGLCFGSFVNALVWRIYEQNLSKKKRTASDKELSIRTGRSMCVNCSHTLGIRDLVPVLSWLSLRGSCRYCKKPISWQYPAVELATALLFALSYAFWPRDITGWELLVFGAWLTCLTGFMALIIYDIRWMLLPNRIIFPLYGVASVYVIARMLEASSFTPLLGAMIGALIGGGIFYLLFEFSKGRWIGGGDVKLGFLLGALAGGPANAFIMLFIASTLGTLAIAPLLMTKRATQQTRIPFGPFLIAGCFIVVLLGKAMSDWYIHQIGL